MENKIKIVPKISIKPKEAKEPKEPKEAKEAKEAKDSDSNSNSDMSNSGLAPSTDMPKSADMTQLIKNFYAKALHLFHEEYPDGLVDGSITWLSKSDVAKIYIHLISPENESDEVHTQKIDGLLEDICKKDYTYEVELTTGYIPDNEVLELNDDEEPEIAGRSYFGITIWPSSTLFQSTSAKKIKPVIQNKSQLNTSQMEEIQIGLSFFNNLVKGNSSKLITREEDLDPLQKQMLSINNKFRDHVRRKFTEVFVNVLGNVSSTDRELDYKIYPSLIERELVLYCTKRCNLRTADWSNTVFLQCYLHKALSIRDNLDPNSYIQNKNLMNRLINKELSPLDIVVAPPHEIFPEQWVEIQQERLRLAEASSKQSMAGTTTLFKCHKCKGTICRYHEQQTRSCDEAMTTFITCMNCGNRWKE